jgi:D-amino peptidase
MSTWKWLCLGLVPVLAGGSMNAQQSGLKVMIVYDMEGISGVTSFKYTTVAHPEEYAEGRKLLTRDVNAAIAGLKAAGVREIVVVDGHGSGNTTSPDVLEDQLLSPARMLYRETPIDPYMDSYDHSVDAIVAIGMHAGAGNSQGFLPHTWAFVDVEYKVNGVPFNEAMLLAMGANRLKIPVIAMSGDDQLAKETRHTMPWVRFAIVKHAVDRSRAEPIAPDEATRRIETAAREGLSGLASARLPDHTGPFRFELRFQDEAQAINAALDPGAVRSGTAVQIRANDFEEGYRASTRLIELARAINRELAAQSVINAAPQSAALHAQVTDWLFGRFLGTLPAATPAIPASPRFWGAK